MYLMAAILIFSDSNSTANKVIYSLHHLYGVKCKSPLPSALFQYLQSLGLLKTRRCRGGKSVVCSSRCYNIKTIISHTNNATTIKAFCIGRCLEKLAAVNRCPLLPPSSAPLNFCLFNAKPIINKTLQIKGYVVDEHVDLLKHGLSLMNPPIFLCVIYTQKDTLSFTVLASLVLVVVWPFFTSLTP